MTITRTSELHGTAQEQVAGKILRNHQERPWIETPDGKLTTYTRTSNHTKAVEDSEGLRIWQQRKAVVGVASRQALVLAVNAHRDDPDMLKKIIEEGMQAAEASAGSTIGTALHQLCDDYDHGRRPYVPDEYAPDVAAYLLATAGLETVAAEIFVVNDEMQTGGSPDRIYRLRGPATMPNGVVLPTGTYLIGDIKTGQKLDHGHVGWAGQLALYSRSVRYDVSGLKVRLHRTVGYVPVGDRLPLVEGAEVNTDWGLIIHVPSGTGTASVHPIDLVVGWELCKLANIIRESRQVKSIHRTVKIVEDFIASAAAAQSVDELMTVHRRAQQCGRWDDDLKIVFSARKAELVAAA